jgi:hypothetical protein
MGMLWACAASGNSDALLLLGLVKMLFFYLLNTGIYLMPVFGDRMSFMNWVEEWRDSNTYCRQQTTRQSGVHLYNPYDRVQQLIGGSQGSPGTCRQVHHIVPS